ncbi:MAG TPA: hypothetical protein VE646_00605 [Actinomycetota bacterium]|nr:hypothetical protein [Actinomycetota bacterium]
MAKDALDEDPMGASHSERYDHVVDRFTELEAAVAGGRVTRVRAAGARDLEGRVLRTLRALGGEATPGDLVAILAHPRSDVEAALEALIASDRVQVKVLDPGDVVYRLAGAGPHLAPRSGLSASPRRALSGPDRAPAAVRFDRKTLHLIRSLKGVISLAELVEHTGTSVAEANREMQRLVSWYGGEGHPSLDGHVVYAFPGLLTSVHTPPGTRAPRPAWMRWGDPMGSRRLTESGSWVGRLAYSLGLLGFGRGLVRRVGAVRAIRFRQRSVLRRLALGHVFQAALAGSGVVSVGSARRYLALRTGYRIGRRRVEAVLRELSGEFDAPVTREGGELFFGFRNVKRQFLAAELVRRRLGLGRRVTGRTVFDSGDTPRAAAQREIEAFDRDLAFAHSPRRRTPS